MDNPFKKLLRAEEVPEVLKEKIINDVSLIKLSIEFADLFAVKYPCTVGEFMRTERNTTKNKNKK